MGSQVPIPPSERMIRGLFNYGGGSASCAAISIFWLASLFIPLPSLDEGSISDTEAVDIAVEAWIYGYPLITMEMTRRVMTNVASPVGKQAPMGQWAKLRTYPDPLARAVTAPNLDTLYTMAWLDLSREPYLLDIPDAKGRYYLLPLLDAWSNVFASLGSRTTGGAAQSYAITGPTWKGTLPEGVVECRAPTNLVWILGRIYCSGTPADYAKVHAFQEKLTLIPLSDRGRPYTPPTGIVNPAIDSAGSVRDMVNRMDPGSYFKLMATLMKANPPAREDAPLLRRMVKIGIVPGRDFDIGSVDPVVAQALRESPRGGVGQLLRHCSGTSVDANGWSYFLKLGRYGTDYVHRAFTAAIGTGANLSEDAVYPVTEADADGDPYVGSKRYVLHFPPGSSPPAEGFWSLAVYDNQYFFAPNEIHRYTRGSRDNLRYNADGSLDIYIQHQSPGATREANWLPVPEREFVLMLRLYWVRESAPSILNGSWQPPPVKVVGS